MNACYAIITKVTIAEKMMATNFSLSDGVTYVAFSLRLKFLTIFRGRNPCLQATPKEILRYRKEGFRSMSTMH